MALSSEVSYALYFRTKGVIIGAVFVVVGMMIILTVAEDWWKGMRSRKWVPFDAVVMVSGEKTVTAHGSEGRTYAVPELDFLYRYEVEGREQLGNGISFQKEGVDVRDIPAFTKRHPEGSTVRIYYNPERPGEAVMEPGVPAAGILFVLMPGVFVVLGLLIIWGSVNGAIVRFCEERGLWYR